MTLEERVLQLEKEVAELKKKMYVNINTKKSAGEILTCGFTLAAAMFIINVRNAAIACYVNFPF